MFDPNQPRAPAGTDIGGQWVAAGNGAKTKKEARRKNAERAKQIIEGAGFKAEIYSNSKLNWAASYSPSMDKISINEANYIWEDVVQNTMKQIQLSSQNPDHIVLHEIGHVLFDPPDNFMNVLQDREFIRTAVSQYASANPKEFVSEVYAGLIAGKKYPASVLAMFSQYARPRKRG